MTHDDEATGPVMFGDDDGDRDLDGDGVDPGAPVVKRFVINEHMDVVLDENGHTRVLVDGKHVLACMRLVMEIPLADAPSYDPAGSIDEAAITHATLLDGEIMEPGVPDVQIDPETEFTGHCSNLQAWHEHGYDVRLLHTNIAWTLLKALAAAGDVKAVNALKGQVEERVRDGSIDSVLALRHALATVRDPDLDTWFEGKLTGFIDILSPRDDAARVRKLKAMLDGLHASIMCERVQEQDSPDQVVPDRQKERFTRIAALYLRFFKKRPEVVQACGADDLVILADEARGFNDHQLAKDIAKAGLRHFPGHYDLMMTIIMANAVVGKTDLFELLMDETFDASIQEDDEPDDVRKQGCPGDVQSQPRIAWRRRYPGVDLPGAEIDTLLDLERVLDGIIIPRVGKIEWDTSGYVTAGGHVTGLGLHGKKLPSLPDSIWQLTSLTVLDLESNNLSSLPVTIGNLVNLKELRLNGNQLHTLPATIGDLVNLKVLQLNGNQLKTLPATVGNLTALEHLDLSENPLQSIFGAIGDLINLEELWLECIQLSSLPEAIGNLVNLKELHLYKNQLQSLPDSIGQLTSLTVLDLESNNLSSLPVTIGNLVNLKELRLNGNQLHTLPETIGNLMALAHLEIRKNPLYNLPRTVEAWIADLVQHKCKVSR